MEKKTPELPELNKARAFDREEHIRRGMAAGLTREQAERHADEDLRGRRREDARF